MNRKNIFPESTIPGYYDIESIHGTLITELCICDQFEPKIELIPSMDQYHFICNICKKIVGHRDFDTSSLMNPIIDCLEET